MLWDTAPRRPLGSPLRVGVGDSDPRVAFNGARQLLASIDSLRQALKMWDTTRPTRVTTARLPGHLVGVHPQVNGDGALFAVGAGDTHDDICDVTADGCDNFARFQLI